MDLELILGVLKGSLNLAHIEDRCAEQILAKDETDIQGAIECHQKAHAHLRTAHMKLVPSHYHKLQAVDEAVLNSLFSQMEHHVLKQSILLNKQRRMIVELKRQPYIATIQEKTAELALMRQQKIQEQLNQQESLLESLKDQLAEYDTKEEETRVSGMKKPKSSSDTIEELRKVIEQLRLLVNELVDENIRLKRELQLNTATLYKEEHYSQEDEHYNSKGQSNISNEDSPIYSLPQALALAALEEPPEFNVDDLKVSTDDDPDSNLN